MKTKKMAVIGRIKHFEDAIAKGNEYLEKGTHAEWNGFRPLFVRKVRDGKEVPPHKDWVKNVFIPRLKRAARKAEKALERLA